MVIGGGVGDRLGGDSIVSRSADNMPGGRGMVVILFGFCAAFLNSVTRFNNSDFLVGGGGERPVLLSAFLCGGDDDVELFRCEFPAALVGELA